MSELLLPALDPRKAAIVSLTPRGGTACEIGADHGILSAHLLRAGVCGRVIVADISAASLDKARRLFAFHGLTGSAVFRVADGLDAMDSAESVGAGAALSGDMGTSSWTESRVCASRAMRQDAGSDAGSEAGNAAPPTAVIIAGLGGMTIVDILARGLDRAGDGTLVLQPNTHPALVRRFLADNGYTLEAERLVWDGHRYYVVLRAMRGQGIYTEKELHLGPWLLRDRGEDWWAYLAWRRACLPDANTLGARESGLAVWIEQELKAT